MDQYANVKYEKPFLAEVVVRLDFTVPVKEFASGLPHPLTRAALRDFPIMEPPEHNLVLKDEGEMGRFMKFEFHSKNKKKHLVITPSMMFMDYKEYDTFEALQDEFTHIVDALFDSQDELMVRRFGLRYINKIHDESNNNVTDWSHLLKDELLSAFNLEIERRSALARVFSNISWNEDDLVLNFNYGMHNADYPVPLNQKEFVLDFDAYFEGALERDEVHQRVGLFHGRIQSLFERCISEELRQIMGRRNG